jgi:hypothetical protein
MAADNYLDMTQMQERFYSEKAMVGISSTLPGYRLCWTINKFFGTDFVNVPENTIVMKEVKSNVNSSKSLVKQVQQDMFGTSIEEQGEFFYFPTYCHDFINSSYHYLLYQLKSENRYLLPEVKHLDYLWLIQTAQPEHDLHIILEQLRKMKDVQLAQELTAHQLKKSIDLLF